MLSEQKEKPDLANFLRQTREVTAEACGVSLTSVKRVCEEGKKSINLKHKAEAGPSFKSPKKSYKRKNLLLIWTILIMT